MPAGADSQKCNGQKFKNPTSALLHFCTIFGGGERDRTDDPLLAKQVLSQLSYTPDKNLQSKFFSCQFSVVSYQ